MIVVTAADVTLRRLEIRGSGDDLSHEDSAVHVSSARFRLEDSRLVDTLFGVYLRSSPNSVIRRNRITPKDVRFTLRGDGVL